MNYSLILNYFLGTTSTVVGVAVSLFLCVYRWRNRFGRPEDRPSVAIWNKFGLRRVVSHITPHPLDTAYTTDIHSTNSTVECIKLEEIKRPKFTRSHNCSSSFFTFSPITENEDPVIIRRSSVVPTSSSTSPV